MLGWKPSPTPTKVPLTSSTKSSSHSKRTSRNIPRTSNASMRFGRRRFSYSIPKASNVTASKVICRKSGSAARLEMGIARVAFMHKKFADAQKLYAEVVDRFGNLAVAAEALYWRAVSQYKATNDHTVLGEVAKELSEKYPDDEWTLKSLPGRIEVELVAADLTVLRIKNRHRRQFSLLFRLMWSILKSRVTHALICG